VGQDYQRSTLSLEINGLGIALSGTPSTTLKNSIFY